MTVFDTEDFAPPGATFDYPPQTSGYDEKPLDGLKIPPGYLQKRLDGERYDSYRGVLFPVSDNWRVAVCHEGRQYILQQRKGTDQWIGRKFVPSKEALAHAIELTLGEQALELVRPNIEKLKI